MAAMVSLTASGCRGGGGRCFFFSAGGAGAGAQGWDGWISIAGKVRPITHGVSNAEGAAGRAVCETDDS